MFTTAIVFLIARGNRECKYSRVSLVKSAARDSHFTTARDEQRKLKSQSSGLWEPL